MARNTLFINLSVLAILSVLSNITKSNKHSLFQ